MIFGGHIYIYIYVYIYIYMYIYIYTYVDKYHGSNPVDIYRGFFSTFNSR